MKLALVDWLACPACNDAPLRVESRLVEARPIWRGSVAPETPGFNAKKGTLDEVIDGDLRCPGCGAVWPIEDGIPQLVAGAASVVHSAHVASVFDAKAPEWEEAFLDFAAPLVPGDFVGRRALDLGCGFGRGTWFAAKYGAEVVGVDVDPEIARVARDNCAEFPHVHIVVADGHRLPFRGAMFDIAWAFGVLHHVDQPWELFREISRTVRSGGRTSLWTYGPRQGSSAALSAMLRATTRDMPSRELLNVSRMLATLIRGVSHTPYRWLNQVPVIGSVVSHLPMHDHHRWPYDIVVADIFDRLRIPVTQTFTAEEIEARYVDEGYLDVHTSRRIRNNESFRATGIRR